MMSVNGCDISSYMQEYLQHVADVRFVAADSRWRHRAGILVSLGHQARECECLTPRVFANLSYILSPDTHVVLTHGNIGALNLVEHDMTRLWGVVRCRG